jgi:hypothetical protein
MLTRYDLMNIKYVIIQGPSKNPLYTSHPVELLSTTVSMSLTCSIYNPPKKEHKTIIHGQSQCNAKLRPMHPPFLTT